MNDRLAKEAAKDLSVWTGPGTLALGDVTTLIVDKDKFESHITSQILHGLGVQHPVCVATAREAMEYLSQHSLDLCLIEHNLPDMSGADLTRWIRKSSHNRHTAIVILTGHARRTNVIECRDSGAHTVVRKPVSAGVLFDHIAWCASARPFVETANYLGPDRRFRDQGPPGGVYHRSTDDHAQIQIAEDEEAPSGADVVMI